MQRNIGHPDIFVSMREERKGKVKCTLKATEQNEIELIRAIMVLAKMYKMQVGKHCYVISFIYCNPVGQLFNMDESFLLDE